MRLKKLYGPVLWMGSIEPLPRGSLLFTTKFPEVTGAHLINLVRLKC